MTHHAMQTAFARFILPESGWYASINISKDEAGKGKANHKWHQSIDELIEATANTPAGVDVYFACSAYSDRRRQQKNVSRVKALWFDLDLKDSPEYNNDLKTALLDVVPKLTGMGLPKPTVVATGGGFHAYYALVESIPHDVWLNYATRFKAALAANGIAADPTRTADGASILRLPGTVNCKRSIRTAQVGGLNGPYTLEQLAPLLGYGPAGKAKSSKARKARKTRTGRAAAAPQPADRYFDDAERAPSADAEVLAEHCPQLRLFRDTGSSASEPHWYASACVLKHCANGREKFHEWSAKDARYDPEETEAKFQNAIASGSGPMTCAAFAERSPACEGCPFKGKITTPLGLSRAAAPQAPAAEPAGPRGAFDMPKTRGKYSVGYALPPVLPGYDAATGRMCVMESAHDGTGALKPVPFVKGDVRLAAVHRERQSTKSECVFLYKEMRGTHYEEITVPMSVCMSRRPSDWAEYFAVYDMNVWGNYLNASIQAMEAAQTDKPVYNSFGWQDDGSFLLGSARYFPATEDTPAGAERALLSKDIQLRASTLGPRDGASFADAVRCTTGLMRELSPKHVGHYFLTLGAPLVYFLNLNEGGLIAALSSSGSGSSKSTVAQMVGGAYGALTCLHLSDSDTTNALGRIFGVMRHLPMVFDDPKKGNNKYWDESWIQELAKRFTAGQDKNALNRNRDLKGDPARWSTILSITSNYNVMSSLTDQSARRVLAQTVPTRDFADRTTGPRLLKELDKHGGAIMHEIMKYLMLHPEVLMTLDERLGTMREKAFVNYKFKTEARFMADSIAVAALMYWLFLQACAVNDCEFHMDMATVWKTLAESADDAMAIVTENEPMVGVDIINELIREKAASTLCIYHPKTVHKAGEVVGGNSVAVVHKLGNDPAISIIFDYTAGKCYINQSLVRKACRFNNTTFNDTAKILGKMVLGSDKVVNHNNRFPDMPLKVAARWLVLDLKRLSPEERQTSPEEPSPSDSAAEA